MEVVKVFTYLGALFCATWTLQAELRARLTAAKAVFARLGARIWRPSILPVSLKLRVYSSLVLSILLYGVAARVTSQEQERRLEVFHLSCIRRIMKKSSYLERLLESDMVRPDAHPRANASVVPSPRALLLSRGV